MRHRCLVLVTVILALAGSACAPGPKPTPTEDPGVAETRVAANVFATQTATAPTPTETPAPTRTPVMASSRPTAMPTSEAGVTSTLKSGWVEYQFKASKFAVAIPPSWEGIEPGSDTVDKLLAGSASQNPQLKTLFSSQQFRSQVAAGLKFYGLDLSPKALQAGFPASVNVMKVDLLVNLSLDSTSAVNLAAVKKMAVPDIPVTQRRVKLGNTDSVRLAYAMKTTDMFGEEITLAVTQYLAVNGKSQYVVTFVCARDMTKTYDPIFEKVAQSFRLLK